MREKFYRNASLECIHFYLQWQAQIQSLIQRKARVLVYSSLPDDIIRRAHLTPCHDITAAVNKRLQQLGFEVHLTSPAAA